MACLYCGKRVSMVRQMADPDFCSDEHRRLYHDIARAALRRLGGLDDAPDEEHTLRTHVLRPRAQEMAKHAAAARRRPAQGPGPRLVVVEPPTPTMCDLARRPLAMVDNGSQPLPAVGIELSARPVFHIDALALAREAIAARGPGGDEAFGFFTVPAVLPASGLQGAARVEGPVDIAVPGLLMGPVEGRSGWVEPQIGPFDFAVLEGRPRRRYARSRAVPPPRLTVRLVTGSREPVVLALRGIAEAKAIARPPQSLVGVYSPSTASDVALKSAAAVRLPAWIALPDGARNIRPARPESARACDFMNLAPAPRRGSLVPVLDRLAIRPPAAVAPVLTAPEPQFGRTIVCGTTPLGASRALVCLPPVQASSVRFDVAPVCRLTSPLPRLAGLALAECGIMDRFGSRPCDHQSRAAIVEHGFGALAGGVALQLPASGAVSGMPASGGTKAFDLLPARAAAETRVDVGGFTPRAVALPVFAPGIRRGRVDTTNPIPFRCRPQTMESAPMEGVGGIIRPPSVRIPKVERAAGGRRDLPPSGPAPAKLPKLWIAASAARFETVPIAGASASALVLPASAARLAPAGRIDAGRMAPEPVAAIVGQREPRPAEVSFEARAVPPAPRAVRVSAAGSVRSAGEVRFGVPRAQAHASGCHSAVTPFAPAPPRFQSLLSGKPAPGINVTTFEYRDIAPVGKPHAPSCASADFSPRSASLPPCPAGDGFWKPAGLAVRPYSKIAAPMRSFAPKLDFSREPGPAPAFRGPAIRLGMTMPAAPVRRALDRLDLQPAGEVMRRLDCPANLRQYESREAALKLAMASRTANISPVAKLAHGSEIRKALAAAARIMLLGSEDAFASVPSIVLPGARDQVPAALAGVTEVAALPLNPRAVERTAARQFALAAVAAPGCADAELTAAMPVHSPRAVAAPYSPGLERLGLPRPKRREEAAQVALCHVHSAGRFGVPANPAVLPRAGYPMFGFTLYEMLDYDDRRHARTRPVEELPPALTIPASKAAPRAQGKLPQPGEMTGFVAAQAGDRATVPADAILSRGRRPRLPALNAGPDTEDRDELLAAVPDRWEGNRIWVTASRFFR
ncbi:MAG: hypothetical protein ACM3ZB_16325 [bacterium]|jgi:hypothetical protein